MKVLVALFVGTMVVFQAGLLSAEQTESAYRMEAVVVSATRSEIPVADAPQSVTVLSEQDIMASPFERVEDILRFSAGIYNTSHYGMQTGGRISHLSMRGTGRNRLLMLLDGVPLNDNFNNTIAWVAWGLIPKESIGRIEIVRGPTSAAYGSEGLGGVINIITKNPSRQRDSSIKGTAGSGNTYGASVFHSNGISDAGFLIAGSYEESDGFYMVDPEGIEDYTTKRYRDALKVFGKATYTVDDRTDVSFSGLYYDQEMGKGRAYFYDDMQLDQYRLGINRRGDLADWSGMLYLNRGDKTAYMDRRQAGEYVPDHKEKLGPNTVWGAEIQNTSWLIDATTLTTGLAYKQVRMDYEEEYLESDREVKATGRQESISPFLDITARFMEDRLIANAGLRYDYIRNHDGAESDTNPDGFTYDREYSSKTWNNLSPKAGVVFHADELTTFRTSVGSGFKPPSLFELYKVHVRGGGTSLTWSNADLDPEKIVTWDIGAERMFFDSLWSRITIYRSWAKDYISSRSTERFVEDGVTDRAFERDNLEEVDIYGIETEMHYAIGYGISSFFNYTYNISKIDKDRGNENIEGNYVPGEPQQKFRAGLTYMNPGYLNASLMFQHDRDRYLDSENTEKAPSINTMDLSLWRTFYDRVTLRLNIENLTDEKKYLSEGILYYGSVQFAF